MVAPGTTGTTTITTSPVATTTPGTQLVPSTASQLNSKVGLKTLEMTNGPPLKMPIIGLLPKVLKTKVGLLPKTPAMAGGLLNRMPEMEVGPLPKLRKTKVGLRTKMPEMEIGPRPKLLTTPTGLMPNIKAMKAGTLPTNGPISRRPTKKGGMEMVRKNQLLGLIFWLGGDAKT